MKCYNLDVDGMKDIIDAKVDSVNDIEDHIELIERTSLKNNVRVFGLPELQDEQDLHHVVVNQVLKVAKPSINWDKNCIDEAYHVGQRSLINPGSLLSNLNSSQTN